MKKKFVRIQSIKTISVTPGLLNIDATDESSRASERLNIRQMWSSMVVQIKQGVGYYPSVVAEWNTTKILVAKGIFTVGETTDDVPEQFAEEANKIYTKLENSIKAYDKAKMIQEQKNAAKQGEKAPKVKKEIEEPNLLDQ